MISSETTTAAPLATLTDQLEYADELAEACDMMADIQIESWQYFKTPSPAGEKSPSSRCTREWTDS